jgi:hypothetical protein
LIGNPFTLAGRATGGATRALFAAALALTCLFAPDVSLTPASAGEAQVRSHEVRARWRGALTPDFPEIVVADLALPNERPGSGDGPDAKTAACPVDEPAWLHCRAPVGFNDAVPVPRPGTCFDPRGPPRERDAA